MRRLIIFWICIALIATGCQSNAPATATDEVKIESTSIPETQTDSLPASSPEVTETNSPIQVETAVTPQLVGCTVISPRPTPGPTQRSIFPPVSSQDWVFGPEDARITLIEYSDFQ